MKVKASKPAFGIVISISCPVYCSESNKVYRSDICTVTSGCDFPSTVIFIVMDLSAAKPHWDALPKPPFQRRALSLGAVDGKVFAIGGMQPDLKVSLESAIFDTKTNAWSKGPSLPGEGMSGFGTSSFAAAGKLYVSNVTGNLYQLDSQAAAWIQAGQLQDKRLFHRMVATANGELLIVGGAEWLKGKAAAVYAIPVANKSTTQR